MMCRCLRFPIFAKSVGKHHRVKAPFFNHLCLDCILEWCLRYPDVPLWNTFWSKTLGTLRLTYYAGFYSEKELEVIRERCGTERTKLVDVTLRHMEPWLLKRGFKRNRCDDEACSDLDCITSLVRVKAGKKGKK
jgi:hypothetical protein